MGKRQKVSKKKKRIKPGSTKFHIPKDLEEHTNPLDAIKGSYILCVANNIQSYILPHKTAGGRGQGADIDSGLCWIEKAAVYIGKKK